MSYVIRTYAGPPTATRAATVSVPEDGRTREHVGAPIAALRSITSMIVALCCAPRHTPHESPKRPNVRRRLRPRRSKANLRTGQTSETASPAKLPTSRPEAALVVKRVATRCGQEDDEPPTQDGHVYRHGRLARRVDALVDDGRRWCSREFFCEARARGEEGKGTRGRKKRRG